MSDNLLPCPFCGGESSSNGRQKFGRPLNDTTWGDETPITEAFFVNCMSCGINTKGSLSVGQQTREKAIAAWNTRTPSDVKQGPRFGRNASWDE